MDAILHLYKPEWLNYNATKMRRGLSNHVYVVKNVETDDTVIVRVYITQPRIDICELSLGPRTLFRCTLGTVEEYISGRTMTYSEMMSCEYSTKIAVELRKLHDAGYTHMDLNHQNVIIDDEDAVRFIDFEHFQIASAESCKNDIANHLCEWMYDHDSPEWFRVIRADRHREMTRFVSTYLNAEPSVHYMNEIQDAMNISHAKWVEWALKYYETTKLERYIHYAQERATLSECIYNKYGKTIYVGGTFDLLHPGHISFLKKARSSVICKKLIVGVMSDAAVTSYKRVPIQSAHERMSMLIELKIVDDVIVNAPFEDEFTSEFLDLHKIDIVVYGGDPKLGTGALERWQHHYRAAIHRNILKVVEYTPGFSTSDLILRITSTSGDYRN